MIPKPIPSDFAVRYGNLSWKEALWGIDNGWADWTVSVALAIQRLETSEESSSVVENLAGLFSNEGYEAIPLARKLADVETPEDPRDIQAKWLYLILRWLFENRHQFSEPLELVECIYAEFGYPGEIAPFVRYMPPADGYDPSAHSRSENEARLYANWAEYLAKRERQFDVGT